MRRAILAAGLFAILASACSSPPFIELPNPLDGQVVTVGQQTFDVETPDGQRYRFINANPTDDAMGQTHMNLHRSDRTPVRVTWRRDGFDLVAVQITDASP